MARISLSSTRKKAVVRRFEREVLKGYVEPSNFLQHKEIELLDREGHLVRVPLDTVKGIHFVSEFEETAGRTNPSVSHGRLAPDGLWIRMTFSDGEVLQGLIPANLMDVEPAGFMLTPVDPTSNSLRVFVPRSALSTVEVLGVIAEGRLRRRPRTGSKLAGDAAQISLFPPPNHSEP